MRLIFFLNCPAEDGSVDVLVGSLCAPWISPPQASPEIVNLFPTDNFDIKLLRDIGHTLNFKDAN